MLTNDVSYHGQKYDEIHLEEATHFKCQDKPGKEKSMKRMKLTRFCEKCGKELIYIKLPNGRMMTCDWEGPVPFSVCAEKFPGRNHYVTSDGKIVCGITPPPDYISGYGHKVHMCEQ